MKQVGPRTYRDAAAFEGAFSITETGGPTVLTLGAVPDTWLIRRIGSALVGVDPAGFSGAPAGVTTQVQFNDLGAFGASADLTWDDATKVLAVGGVLSLKETTAPGATAGFGKLYVKSADSRPYFKDDGGAEVALDIDLAPFVTTKTPALTSVILDFAGEDRNQTIDLSLAAGDVTVTFLNMRNGGVYGVKVIQGATARNLIWPGTVKWVGGVAPVISLGSGDIDLIQLLFDGTNQFGLFNQDFA